jgi:hypothetical protein
MTEICDTALPWLHIGLAYGFGLFTGVVFTLAWALRRTARDADAADEATGIGA